jgi:excisionase family DNA binding protein
MTKRLLTIQEAAAETGLLTSYMRKMVFERKVPYMKIGRRIYFDWAELNQWIDLHRVSA